MTGHFGKMLTNIQSSIQLQQFESPVNLISYGDSNLSYTSAEVTLAYYQEQLALIIFVGWTEKYQNRIIAISSFDNHQQFISAKKEIEREMHFDLTKTKFDLIFEN